MMQRGAQKRVRAEQSPFEAPAREFGGGPSRIMEKREKRKLLKEVKAQAAREAKRALLEAQGSQRRGRERTAFGHDKAQVRQIMCQFDARVGKGSPSPRLATSS